jgi:hypothetical protein
VRSVNSVKRIALGFETTRLFRDVQFSFVVTVQSSCHLPQSQWRVSTPQTLGSWVQISLEIRVLCIRFSVVLSCVDTGIATGWPPMLQNV